MPTLQEREKLMQDVMPHMSGFCPYPNQMLVTQRRPHTKLDIECCHFLRISPEVFIGQHPTLQHQLWVEAGKHEHPSPVQSSTDYSSNVWQNFCESYGICRQTRTGRNADVLRIMYALSIPPASSMGNYTFEKYICETSLFKDNSKKLLAIRQTKSNMDELVKLKYRSQARNPPLHQSGHIAPPENYKHYADYFVPETPPHTPLITDHRRDMFGQKSPLRCQPRLWKLLYRLNHPEYQKLKEEIKRKRNTADSGKKMLSPSSTTNFRAKCAN